MDDALLWAEPAQLAVGNEVTPEAGHRAGDVLELTRDVKLALDWIGDVDLGMARRYLRPRDPRLEVAASAVDRLLGEISDRNRHATVTEPRAAWEDDSEPSDQLELIELGREDSNLQLPG